jgi:hypothetical protein
VPKTTAERFWAKVEGIIADGETLRGSLLSMKARRRAALIVKEAEKLRGELAVGSGPSDPLRSASLG